MERSLEVRQSYQERRRALTPTVSSAAQLLVRKRPKVVGTDELSLEGWSGKMVVGRIAKTPSRTIHRMLLEA